MLRELKRFLTALTRGGPRDVLENSPRLTREIGRTRSPQRYSKSRLPADAVSCCAHCLKPLHYDGLQGYCPEHGEPEVRSVEAPLAKAGGAFTDTEVHSDEVE
jgi:hypothetical protein